MNYLLYIEHAAENLQFYLWLKDYTQRFHEAKTSDIALSPEWTQAQHDAALQAAQAQITGLKRPTRTHTAAGEIFKDTDFEKVPKITSSESSDPFATPPRTPAAAANDTTPHPWESSTSPGSDCRSSYTYGFPTPESYQQSAGEAFAAAGLKQPCKQQSANPAALALT
jgi:hypothetical protein